MDGKKLALTNGLVGLIGGILLVLAPVFLVSTAYSDVTTGTSGEATAGLSLFFLLLKIAILVLGIIGATKFKNSEQVSSAPSVLLIVGGAVALVPLLGVAGGIVSIVGGGLYLSKLKNFN